MNLRQRWRSISLGVCLVALAPACGVRSQLRGGEPCPEDGESQACVGVCGDGITTCQDGFWSPCDIPPKEETCQGVCGQGLRRCEAETWSACAIPPKTEGCENECGFGERSCENERWSECHVAPVTEDCTFGCGPGSRTCEDNTWGACDAPRPLPPTLTATIRDFKQSHPDFERGVNGAGRELGIVEDLLGPDAKPVYAGGPQGTSTTSGPEYFDQWYRDVPGVNQSTSITITLQPSSTQEDFYVYTDRSFFPIDGQLFGNEGNPHNYHFTLEAEATFVYRPGQIFAFDGDDDIWVFINNWLVIDLGGLHTSLRESVSLDQIAPKIGLVQGGEYPLKIFFAERHTVDSNFVIETSIANLGMCPN